MKATKLFYGIATYGQHIEVALGANGKWYFREFIFNGYGKRWSKWTLHNEGLIESYEGYNQYSGEKFTRDEPVYYWGFNQLTELKDPKGVRLPNE